MPKNSALGGPSYDGHVDVSPDDVSQPEWVAAAEVVETVSVGGESQVVEPLSDELPDEPDPIELDKPSPAPRGKHETDS